MKNLIISLDLFYTIHNFYRTLIVLKSIMTGMPVHYVLFG